MNIVILLAGAALAGPSLIGPPTPTTLPGPSPQPVAEVCSAASATTTFDSDQYVAGRKAALSLQRAEHAWTTGAKEPSDGARISDAHGRHPGSHHPSDGVNYLAKQFP
ncbi:hypothetical protein GCM10009798_06040 [Nocardioides panacihumi]|uniref:SCP domain-containing protein n=1 Tax=Nocardioides panacihumi TaxID=400774 RepID=A0ABN2QD68_9ACTN